MLMKIEQLQEALETAHINTAVLTSIRMAQIALKNMEMNVDQVGIYLLWSVDIDDFPSYTDL